MNFHLAVYIHVPVRVREDKYTLFKKLSCKFDLEKNQPMHLSFLTDTFSFFFFLFFSS